MKMEKMIKGSDWENITQIYGFLDAPVFTHIRVAVPTRSWEHSSWVDTNATANFEALWSVCKH